MGAMGKHTEKSGECMYCGRYIADAERIPSLGDDAGWEAIRHEHDDDCEWWSTRANRREIPEAVDGATTVTYRVRMGGESPDSGEVFDDLDDAIAAAWELAEDRVTDSETEKRLGYYDMTGRGGARGVCPEGDEGGYWPIVEEVQ